MRSKKIVLLILIGALAPARASAEQPYQGVWGANQAACRAQDGTDRMAIKGNRFDWYETHCVTETVSQAGARWTLKLACQGEGKKWRATTRLSMPSKGRLVLDNAPVGPTKRQTYVRCAR